MATIWNIAATKLKGCCGLDERRFFVCSRMLGAFLSIFDARRFRRLFQRYAVLANFRSAIFLSLRYLFCKRIIFGNYTKFCWNFQESSCIQIEDTIEPFRSIHNPAKEQTDALFPMFQGNFRMRFYFPLYVRDARTEKHRLLEEKMHLNIMQSPEYQANLN